MHGGKVEYEDFQLTEKNTSTIEEEEEVFILHKLGGLQRGTMGPTFEKRPS
jgi:hypothetical protein